MSVLLSNVPPYVGTNADISIHITKPTDNVCCKTAFLVRKSQHTGETYNRDYHFNAVVYGYILVHTLLDLNFKLKKTASHKIPSLQFVTTHDFQQQPLCISTFHLMKFRQK